MALGEVCTEMSVIKFALQKMRCQHDYAQIQLAVPCTSLTGIAQSLTYTYIHHISRAAYSLKNNLYCPNCLGSHNVKKKLHWFL